MSQCAVSKGPVLMYTIHWVTTYGARELIETQPMLFIYFYPDFPVESVKIEFPFVVVKVSVDQCLLTSSTAEPMLQARGFPPNVLKWSPLAKEQAISAKITQCVSV